MQLPPFYSLLPAMLAASGALAANAAPPFEAIARKFASNPDTLAFSIVDPHPRMNVTLTRREAQDVAAYINTLAK